MIFKFLKSYRHPRIRIGQDQTGQDRISQDQPGSARIKSPLDQLKHDYPRSSRIRFDSSAFIKVGKYKYGGTFLYRRVNGVFDATKQWYYCCDLKWCFMCDIMFLLFQYLRSYFPFSPSFSISSFCCFNTYTDFPHFSISLHMLFLMRHSFFRCYSFILYNVP